jgi:uncharacterized protein (DUF4415 family)
MAFEWDEEKREGNLVKHGVDFRDVPPMFDEPTLEVVDDRSDYGETRINVLGEIEGRSLPSPTHGDAPAAASSAREKPMSENKERITLVTRDEARRLKGETDYARLDAMTDDDIVKAVANDPNLPPLDVDWSKANLVIPPGKDVITLRLDRDLLDWLRAQGKGYQTRINQVLRAWRDATLHEKGLAIQQAAEKRAAKKAAATRKVKKAAAKPATPARKRA